MKTIILYLGEEVVLSTDVSPSLCDIIINIVKKSLKSPRAKIEVRDGDKIEKTILYQ